MENLITIQLGVTCLVVFGLLLIGEYLSRKKRKVLPEVSRKFVHISVGSFVAFWPLFLSWNQILLMSAAFLVAVVVSRRLHIFHAIHTVQRPTWGEAFFALVVGLLALMTHDGWIFAAAVLHMSLADGLAAIVGMRYGKKRSYLVFGHRKSLAGSATFLLFSLLILAGYVIGSGQQLPLALLVGVSLGATVLEGVGIRGVDNLSVPLFVVLLLSSVA